MKKLIRLTESDLHNIIKESVKRIINEAWDHKPSREELERFNWSPEKKGKNI